MTLLDKIRTLLGQTYPSLTGHREVAELLIATVRRHDDAAGRAKLSDEVLLDNLTEHERRVFELGYRNGYHVARAAIPTPGPRQGVYSARALRQIRADGPQTPEEAAAISEGPGS